MLAQLMSAAVTGVDAYMVQVEVDLAQGLPCMNIVGLPESAVREGRERVSAALAYAGVELPTKRITVNLSPADVAKRGSAFDLPLALGLLLAAGEIPHGSLRGACVVGELGLDGEVRPVRGVLSIADRCRQEGIHTLFVPVANAAEAAIVSGMNVYATPTLPDAVAHLRGSRRLQNFVPPTAPTAGFRSSPELDYAEVRGQQLAKRALEIAAAGHHNLIMMGPPGAGKSMIARRLAGILPPLSVAESIEVTKIYSVAGRLNAHQALVTERPFRAPHHSISDAAMVGGGPQSRCGEVTLAHRGVLFLDELPEFKRNVLESLRQPVEDGVIVVGRAREVLAYPARFMLVAAMNPCPCGYHGAGSVPCICSPLQVQRYVARISGPLLDRIDLHVRVPSLNLRELERGQPPESSAFIRARVLAARDIQSERFEKCDGVHSNSQLGVRDMRRYCALSSRAQRMLQHAARATGMSARSYHRVLRLARTIADLAATRDIDDAHIAEAVQFRGAVTTNEQLLDA